MKETHDNFFDMNIILESLFFLIFLITCLYLPGKLLLAQLRITLTSPHDLFFSFGFGLLIFTLIAYLFSWMNLENLLLPCFLILSFLSFYTKSWKPLPLEKKHYKPLSVVFLFAIIFSLTMLATGKFGDMIVFRHDDTWHLALINELKAHFPPDNPGFAGIPLKGYHFFYNFVLAKISNLFFLSPLSLHFHFFPLFVALLWGLGVYSLMITWSKKISTALWAVFLTMFGGSFAFILVLQGHSEISLDSGLGIAQLTGSLYNPPFALSIIIVITFLFALYQYLETKEYRWLVPIVLSVGLVTMVKVYAGMLLIGGFFILLCYEFMKKRTIIFFALFAVILLFFSTYWIFGENAGYLIFYPWWPPHTLLQSFQWYNYDEKVETYRKLGVFKGLITTEIYGFSLFILGNLGTRLIGLIVGFLVFIKKRKLPSLFAFIVVSMTTASLLTPLLFIQSGKVFEIIQLAWYYLFFSSLFAAFGFTILFSREFPKLLKAILFLFIIMSTLPSAFEMITSSLTTFRSQTSLASPYFQTVTFLSKQGHYDDTVLEMPPLDFKSTVEDSKQWYDRSTPTFLAFSNKRGYLHNEFIEFPNVDIKPRLTFLSELILFSKISQKEARYESVKDNIAKKLKRNNIHYIYSPYEVPNFETIEGITKIYQNELHTIYQVAYH